MRTRSAIVTSVAMLAAVIALPAQAQTYSYSYDQGDSTVQYMCNAGHCFTNTWKKGTATGRRESEQDAANRVERERAWNERCKPEKYVDDEGLSRYRYAAEGCDGEVLVSR
jgi:hypothetical protein